MFLPQIVGGTGLPGLVTIKVSVKHCVFVVYGTPTPTSTPNLCKPTVTVEVEGPRIENVLKSSLKTSMRNAELCLVPTVYVVCIYSEFPRKWEGTLKLEPTLTRFSGQRLIFASSSTLFNAFILRDFKPEIQFFIMYILFLKHLTIQIHLRSPSCLSKP